MTNLAIDMIVETAYINENIEKVRPKRCTLMPSTSNSAAIYEGIDNAAYIENDVKTKQRQPEDYYSASSCVAVYQRVVMLLSKVHLFVGCSARDVQLETSHKNLVENS